MDAAIRRKSLLSSAQAALLLTLLAIRQPDGSLLAEEVDRATSNSIEDFRVLLHADLVISELSGSRKHITHLGMQVAILLYADVPLAARLCTT